MNIELDIMTQAWQNFCQTHWGNDTRFLTVQSVNQQLKSHGAHCKDLGEWRVFFTTEKDLSFFLLKYN
jgi:hypothetical protein